MAFGMFDRWQLGYRGAGMFILLCLFGALKGAIGRQYSAAERQLSVVGRKKPAANGAYSVSGGSL